jgi:hypothetical protein
MRRPPRNPSNHNNVAYPRRPRLPRSIRHARRPRHATKRHRFLTPVSLLEVRNHPYHLPTNPHLPCTANLTIPPSVLFRYPTFTVSYESGIDNIPRFDAHIEVYSANKSVRIQYDTPYVKGLPITMHVSENANGAYRESMMRKSYEDAYTLEMKKLWRVVVEGERVKTTAEDALGDLELFGMVMRHGFGGAEA